MFGFIDCVYQSIIYEEIYCRLIECRGCFDVHEDDPGSPSSRDSAHLDSEQQSQQQPLPTGADEETAKNDGGDSRLSLKRIPSIPVLQENSLPAKYFNGDGDRYILLS